MGLEIENVKQLKGIWDPNDVSTNTKIADEVPAIGTEINGVAKDAANVDSVERNTESQKSAFVSALDAKLQNDANNAFVPGANLMAFLDANISDASLRAEVDGYIREIERMTPAQYLTEFARADRNSVKSKLLEVYIRNERIKQFDRLDDYMAMDKSVSITQKIENVRQGYYKDENGVMQDLGLRNPQSDVYVYPSNDYEKDALYMYETEVLAPQMDVMMRAGLLKLEEEGKLDDAYKGNLAKAVIEAVEGPGADDKVFEAYINKRGGIGKLAKRHEAVMKRREELKHVTIDEIHRELKDSTFKSLEKYLKDHDNGDGTYNLSEISEAIEYRVGKDFLVNRNDDPNKILAELEGVREELGAGRHIVDIENFDPANKYRQTKDLIEFCGFKTENRNHTPSIVDAAKAIFGGAAAGTVAHVAAPQVAAIEINKYLNLSQTVTLNGEIISLQVIDEVKNIIINVDRWDNVLKAAAAGGLTALALSTLEQVIFGRDIDFERECFDKSDFDRNSERYTIKANYEQYLKDKGDEQYERIKFLLDQYPARPDGTWDYDGFFNFLRLVAGLGSNLNCEEIAGAKMYPDVTPPVPTPPVRPKLIQTETVEKVEEHVPYEIKEETESKFTSKDGIGKATWRHLANELYDCENPSLKDIYPNPNDRIRVIKLAQCINDGDSPEKYSKERMDFLLNLSKLNPQELRNVPYFNADAYFGYTDANGKQVLGVLNAPTLPQEPVRDENGNIKYKKNGQPEMQFAVKLPPVLCGVSRCEITGPEIFDAKYTGTIKKVAVNVGSSTFYEASGEHVITRDGDPKYVLGVEGGGERRVFNSEEERAQEAQELQDAVGAEAPENLLPDEFEQRLKKPEEQPQE